MAPTKKSSGWQHMFFQNLYLLLNINEAFTDALMLLSTITDILTALMLGQMVRFFQKAFKISIPQLIDIYR